MAGAVYWVGADGNVYLKSAAGVQNVGSANGANYNLGNGGFESNTLKQSIQAQRINDPNPPKTAPAGGSSGGGGGTTTQDRSNDIALQQAGLGAVDSQTSSGLSAIDKALASLTGQYDTESAANEGNYKGQSTTNQNNLQKNKQSALVNAAQGRQGLYGTLASLGALNGSGVTLANQAVQRGANDDLSGAGDTYDTNQSGLDTAIGTFRAEDKERRQDADTAASDARTSVQNQGAKSKQTFLSNLANDFSAEGNAGQAKAFSDQAAALYPSIASTSVPSTSLGYQGAAFTPGTLGNYLSGANSTAVTATPTQGGKSPGLFASTVLTGNDKKKLVTA